MVNEMNDLTVELNKINKDLIAGEEILNDGIDYGQEFRDEINKEIKSLVSRATEIKKQLKDRCGVIAI